MYSKWSVSARKLDIYWHWICKHAEILFQIPLPEKSTIWGLPKMDHSGSAARIVLEQNKFSKKLPPTGIETYDFGTSSFCYIAWKTETLKILI